MRLRPATEGDRTFCEQLNEATLREYVEPIYGWDNEQQHSLHEAWFRAERLSIIEAEDGRAIGVLDATDEGDHLYLSRILILPDAQGRGVGAAVMRELLREGRTVRLHVFTTNTRARRFYERLGFVVDHEAERPHHISMVRAGRPSC